MFTVVLLSPIAPKTMTDMNTEDAVRERVDGLVVELRLFEM